LGTAPFFFLFFSLPSFSPPPSAQQWESQGNFLGRMGKWLAHQGFLFFPPPPLLFPLSVRSTGWHHGQIVPHRSDERIFPFFFLFFFCFWWGGPVAAGGNNNSCTDGDPPFPPSLHQLVYGRARRIRWNLKRGVFFFFSSFPSSFHFLQGVEGWRHH